MIAYSTLSQSIAAFLFLDYDVLLFQELFISYMDNFLFHRLAADLEWY